MSDFTILDADEGVSTDVFKLEREQEVFFLRIMPEGENASSQVLAHKLMLEKGVSVPRVESYNDFFSGLGERSYMLVRDIGGKSLKEQIDLKKGSMETKTVESILVEAGKQLALINSIPVQGFGEVSRAQVDQTSLFADDKGYQEWLDNFISMLDQLKKEKMINKESYSLIIDKYSADKNIFSYNEAFLAHGDFDLSHFNCP